MQIKINKMNIPNILFIFLTLVTCSVFGEPNDCCPDKGPIIEKRCSDGNKSWTKTCESGAYILLEGQYSLSENDTLILTDSERIIEKNRYCLGSIEKNTERIALICFAITLETERNNLLTTSIIQIFFIISVICLSLTIAVYIFLPKLRDLQGKCIMITITNLLFAYVILFAVQQSNQYGYAACMTLASLMYFAFLSTFFWINIVAINIWRIIIKPRFLSNNKYLFTVYNIYGWCGPLIFLTVALISHHVPGNHIKPGWTEYSCWFTVDSELIYFNIPILVLLSINMLIFISVGCIIWKNEKNNINNDQSTNFRLHKSRKYKCILYLKLFLIMGITWIFEPISKLFYHGFYLWLIIDYVNALQGVIIFFLLVVFRKRVRRELARRGGILCGKLPSEWALIPDEEMEELEDNLDEEEIVNELHVQLNQPF